MSFLTEYFDEYRPHPIRRTKLCPPEDRWAKLDGKWLDPKKGKEDREWTDEEIEEFVKMTMHSLRGQSTYFNDYCAHLDQSFKTRKFVPQEHKTCPVRAGRKTPHQLEEADLPQELDLKDTEVMKEAHRLYNRDLSEPTLKPLDTSARILGYCRPSLYHTGLTEYQASISRLAYELVRDNRIPRYVASNGGRPKWGYPPELPRQPMTDGVPMDGERLY